MFIRKKFSSRAWKIIEKSGDVCVEYAEKVEEYLEKSDLHGVECYGNDLFLWLEDALRRFKITSVELELVLKELGSMVVR